MSDIERIAKAVMAIESRLFAGWQVWLHAISQESGVQLAKVKRCCTRRMDQLSELLGAEWMYVPRMGEIPSFIMRKEVPGEEEEAGQAP